MLDTEQLYFRAYTEVCADYGLKAERGIFLEMVGADSVLYPFDLVLTSS